MARCGYRVRMLRRLQWGRSDEGAETRPRPWNSASHSISFNGAAPMKERKHNGQPHRNAGDRLQWGRSDEGAETRAGRAVMSGTRRFNGAAPMKERKLRAIRMFLFDSKRLQWGRSDEGAETHHCTGCEE